MRSGPIVEGDKTSRAVHIAEPSARAVAVDALVTAALQTASEGRGEGLILTDASGRIVTVNRTAERILGQSGRELIGRQCRRMLRCLDRNAFGHCRASCQGAMAVSNGQTVHRVLRTSIGQRLEISGRSSHVFGEDNALLGTICVFSRGHGESTLDPSAAEFLSDVSHELRTPLSSLATSIELLSSSYRQMPRHDVDRVLQVIHHSTLQLHNLVENLLSASSIQTGCFHIQPRPSDLREIIDEATTFVQPILDKKHQRLQKRMPDDLPLVMADSRRIVQVIINLLSNANKYGPSDDEIVVSVVQGLRHILISVHENGPGIAPEEQHNIFERFYRSRRNVLEGQHGTGLGLALVKSTVIAHAGKVGVQSQPGAGSTFWFTLPVVNDGRRTQKGDRS